MYSGSAARGSTHGSSTDTLRASEEEEDQPPAEGDGLVETIRRSPLAELVRVRSAEGTDALPEAAGAGWSGSIEGFCPVQGNGVVDDRFWHFRARGEEWSFEVYSSPPARRRHDDEPEWSRAGDYDGDAASAGWMRFSEAWALIEEHIAQFRKDRANDGGTQDVDAA